MCVCVSVPSVCARVARVPSHGAAVAAAAVAGAGTLIVDYLNCDGASDAVKLEASMYNLWARMLSVSEDAGFRSFSRKCDRELGGGGV